MWFLEEKELVPFFCRPDLDPPGYEHKHPTYKRGEFVYSAEDKSDKVYLIMRGKVRIVGLEESGQEVVKAILTGGDIFGESALTGENRREDFAEVIENETSLCPLHATTVTSIMSVNPQFAFSILKLIGIRLKRLERRLSLLIYKDVKTRLVEFLLDLALEFGKEENGVMRIKAGLSQKNIADLIGASRQTVNSTLKELERDGALTYSRREILLTLSKVSRT